MEAFFDNKINILNARICAALDESVMYTVETEFQFAGRARTLLRDENPLAAAANLPFASHGGGSAGEAGGGAVVGGINWRQKFFEVHGHRRNIADLKRSEGTLFNKKKFWRWGEDRKEYETVYTHEEWKALLHDEAADGEESTPAARFCIPFRPHLFSKTGRPVIHLKPAALAEDEVFLILLLIYLEVKRQERTNTAVSVGTSGW
ncbi:hypothetical protein C8J57DRAFT_1355986 [Mycena rebaudengoi]|nr:hypothetical protein C8J57DRAFT_1362797 [Mycena rebaudengoi]KAJ7249930.1 hypothetical protein C8J57DRAFT_1355986 [Mycena rebaudengoi]